MTVKDNLDRILKDTKNYNSKIIAVTKYYGVDKMIEAYDAGLRDFAESKVLDAVAKIGKMWYYVLNMAS